MSADPKRVEGPENDPTLWVRRPKLDTIPNDQVVTVTWQAESQNHLFLLYRFLIPPNWGMVYGQELITWIIR